MDIDVSVAHCHIVGMSEMSQSRQHEEPSLKDEKKDQYDLRTWRSKLNVETIGGKPTVVIPAHGMHQAITAAAKFSKRRIEGMGTSTWTARFTSGISILDNISLGIDPNSVGSVVISANVDGVRGSGKRVPRKFPVIDQGWEAKFDVQIMDSLITEDIFEEMLTIAGTFIGVGRFRPEKGGTNGRFRIKALKWTDNRSLAA